MPNKERYEQLLRDKIRADLERDKALARERALVVEALERIIKQDAPYPKGRMGSCARIARAALDHVKDDAA